MRIGKLIAIAVIACMFVAASAFLIYRFREYVFSESMLAIVVIGGLALITASLFFFTTRRLK